MIYSNDGRKLDSGAREENLVRDVVFAASDGALHNLQLHLAAREIDDAGARDAFENIVGARRRDELAIANDEQVASSPFGNVTAFGQKDRTSYPLRRASSVARTLFTYVPQILARPEMALSWMRRQDTTPAFNPLALSK